MGRGKPFALGLCIVAVLSAAITARDNKKESSTSELLVSFDPPSFNFGTVLQNEIVQHEFRLVNRSSNEMRIVSLQTSCSCTLAAEASGTKVIPPHDAIVIPVEFHSGARDGSVSSSVTVRLEENGGHPHFAQAILQGNVNADFTIDPLGVDFGALKPGQEATQKIVLRPKALTSISITNLRSSGKEFQVALQQDRTSASADTMAEIFITFRAPKMNHRQPFSEILQVNTSSQRVPEFGLPLRGLVVPDVEIVPDVLVLPSDTSRGESRVTLRTEEPSRIVRVSSETSAGIKELPSVQDQTVHEDSGVPPGWRFAHVCHILHSNLRGAQQINIAFEIRHGADRIEARSVSVQVKSL